MFYNMYVLCFLCMSVLMLVLLFTFMSVLKALRSLCCMFLYSDFKLNLYLYLYLVCSSSKDWTEIDVKVFGSKYTKRGLNKILKIVVGYPCPNVTDLIFDRSHCLGAVIYKTGIQYIYCHHRTEKYIVSAMM
jgi:hypothetical protein